MPEIRDPAIKLFGKMIALQSAESGGGGGEEEDKGHLTSKDREKGSPDLKESSEPVSSSEYDKGNHSSSDDQEKAPENNSKAEEEEEDDDDDDEEEEEHNDSSNPMLKKPDKILPCPRCNSLETKFCYYNNYNVNQPRHFCKNCQRYWTAGGTMRNVPVGAGRRKNKNSVTSSLYHHLTVSDVGLQAKIPEQIHRPPPLRSNGTVLSFRSDAPLTMASALNLPEKQMISCHRNGVHPAEEHMEEQSSLSPVTQDCQSFSSTNVPCQFPWTPPPPPPPALCASSYPMPFYPPAAAYWGFSPWGLPWLSSLASPSPPSGWSVSGPDHCPALGKHSREEDAVPGDSSSSERRRLWIPKTLRIHDPEEAAKSSIWASMGFKSDDDGQGFFKTLIQTKGELSRTHLGEASSQALHANPAALSRSINFLESS